MKRLLWHWIISAAALWLTTLALQHGVTITHWYHVLWLAPLLGLVNVAVSALARVISWIAFPVNLLTLGCFGFILSFFGYIVALVYLDKQLSVLHITGFGWAVALAVVMALFSSLLNIILPGKTARR